MITNALQAFPDSNITPREEPGVFGNENAPQRAAEKEKTEPIAGRIIELPENEELAETYRSPRSGFIAYVPTGSVKKGMDLVTTGGAKIVGNQFIQGKTTPCITCHGPDLMGVADVPPIAGRSPSYMVRQLFDIQQGTRPTQPPQLMKFIVANLTKEDMVAIAAYVSSRKPVYTTGTPAQTTRAALQ